MDTITLASSHVRLNMLIGFKCEPKPNKTKLFTYHYKTYSMNVFYEAILFYTKVLFEF